MDPSLEMQLREYDLDGAEGASDEAIAEIEATFGKELPAALREILEASDGLSVRGRHHELVVWSCREIIDYNCANKVQTVVPECVMFGSDGLGNSYALDYRKAPPAIALLPAIGFDYKSALPVAGDIHELLRRLEEPGTFK